MYIYKCVPGSWYPLSLSISGVFQENRCIYVGLQILVVVSDSCEHTPTPPHDKNTLIVKNGHSATLLCSVTSFYFREWVINDMLHFV